jgi:DNA-binding GntR family transcriptional regulator
MVSIMETADELSQSERAYRVLHREILHGAVMPGERLRAADLHERYDLGLTPIREALMRFTSKSLVEGEANRGSRARDVSIAELRDLMGTRREIERLCLTASIARGDAQWEAEIVASLHLLSRTALPTSDADIEAAAQWETLHRRFHIALIAACDSPSHLRL